MNDFKGKTALITGASSGIGMAMARQLAEKEANLIIVARRKERLEALKSELEGLFSVSVTVIDQDLSSKSGCKALVDVIDAAGLRVDYLVNNAGFGYEGAFVGQDPGRLRQMMYLNIDAVTFLSRHYGKKMADSKEGGILLVSSVGGFIPCPGMGVYDAAKAYVLLFGEALATELKPKNVTVTILCPGATRTEFFDVSGQDVSFLVKATSMKPESVARAALKGFQAGKLHVIPGILNRLTVISLRFVPRVLMAPLARLVMG